jgi:hypothetical protein
MGCLIASTLALLLVQPGTSKADTWPPADPGQYVTEKDFTLSWAKSLRGFHTLAELQKAAGSKGKISGRSLEGNDPTVEFHWRSEPTKKASVGYMLATVRPNGQIDVSILTTNNEEVILNTKGAFVCDKCNPPISISPRGSN